VSGENGVVWLNNGVGDLRGRIDGELQLALLAVVDGQTLHEQRTETRACATTEGVEDEEALKTGAVVGNTADLVEDLIDELLANSVVTTGVVVGRIFLASDHVLGVEEGSVGASADLINNIGLEIAVDGTGNIFALTYTRNQSLSCLSSLSWMRTGLGEEGAEALIGICGLAFRCEVSIGLSWQVSGVINQVDDEGLVPECRARGSTAEIVSQHGRLCLSVRVTNLPARVGDLATSLADCENNVSVCGLPGCGSWKTGACGCAIGVTRRELTVE
jgi:hypothetical protein